MTNDTLSRELLALFRADQLERKNPPPVDTPAYRLLRRRDEQRRQRVRDIVAAAGPALSAENLYFAALVLHHGGNIDEVQQAHQLAQESAGMGHRPARWLTAATLDRWLMMQGQPQKYGTQIVPDGHRFRVWEVDPATTDAERANWDVRSLARQQQRAAEMTQTDPQPDMARAPDWLKAALKRWQHDETSA